MKDELINLLPTLAAKIVASFTIAIAGGLCFFFQDWVVRLGLSLSALDKLLLQWALMASVLFIGTLVVLVLIMAHYRKRKSYFG